MPPSLCTLSVYIVDVHPGQAPKSWTLLPVPGDANVIQSKAVNKQAK